MNNATTIDLTALLDSRKLGRFHLEIPIVCGLCSFVSGFFVVGLGFIAPVATTVLNTMMRRLLLTAERTVTRQR